jgi:uncharacterized Zn finger protein
MNDIVDITDQQLIALAGAGAYERGVDYFHSDRVLNWSKLGSVISAEVDGTQTYKVTLRHTARQFDGGCDCLASEGFDFCKHCVAVALAYRQDSNQQVQLESGSENQRIEAFLQKLGKQELLEKLLGIILNDRSLKNAWSVQADIALNKMDHKALKKRVTAAIPYNRHLFRYPQVRAYFVRVDEVVALLEMQLEQLPPARALLLVEYALARIDKALESVDDSGGFRLPAMEALAGMHLRLLPMQDWSNIALVDYLLEIGGGPLNDMYPPVPYGYADILAKDGMEMVFERLQQQWDALPNLPAGASWERKYPYVHLEQLLRQRAEELQQPETVIGLLEKTATTELDCLKLCELCIAQADWSRVEHWLGRAREMKKPSRNPWRKSHQLERVELQLLLQQGKTDEALQLQEQVFRESLVVRDYTALLALAAELGATHNYATSVQKWLLSRLEANEQGRFTQSSADALVAIYLQERQLDKALQITRMHKVDDSQLEVLALACSHRADKAIPLFAQLANARIVLGNNEVYRRGVAYLQQAAATVSNAEEQILFDSILQNMRSDHKAKRNFIKYLAEAFPSQR